MFVCLERMGALRFSLIGLTSDVVCVWVYYTGCVVISNLQPDPLHPDSSRHCPTPLLLYTSLQACTLPTRHLPAAHTHEALSRAHRVSHTEIHTHMPLLSKQSYPMCLQHSDGTPEETLQPCINTLHLFVPFFFFSKSRGVISDRELIINSIKWVWSPW